MKTKTLFILSLFFFHYSISQKIASIKKDPFEGQVDVYSSLEQVAPNLKVKGNTYSSLYLGGGKQWVTGETYLIFQFKSSSAEILGDDKECKIHIRLENDVVIKVKDYGKYRIYSPGETISFFFYDRDGLLEQWLDKRITDIRIETYHNQFDFKINQVSADKIKKIYELMMDYKYQE